jgi:hypothetical protein
MLTETTAQAVRRTGPQPAARNRLDLGTPTWLPGERSPVFAFGHRLADEELLGLDAIAQLADRLAPELTETAPSDQDHVVADFRPVKWTGPGAGGAVREVADRRLWVALSNIEQDPLYRELIDSLFAEFVDAARIPSGVARSPEGYLFISAARTTVPFHIDHEHNLFFQVRGEKHFSVGQFPDDDHRSRTLEGMYSGEYGATDHRPAGVVTHVMHPGDGLFIPPDGVHAVETSSEVSISLSLVWSTDELARAASVYAVNHHLRRLHLSPRPPGASVRSDRAKAAFADVWRWARRPRRGSAS